MKPSRSTPPPSRLRSFQSPDPYPDKPTKPFRDGGLGWLLLAFLAISIFFGIALVTQ